MPKETKSKTQAKSKTKTQTDVKKPKSKADAKNIGTTKSKAGTEKKETKTKAGTTNRNKPKTKASTTSRSKAKTTAPKKEAKASKSAAGSKKPTASETKKKAKKAERTTQQETKAIPAKKEPLIPILAVEKEIPAKPIVANPLPLGLLGFGMATILLSLSNTGIIEMNVVILAMGIFIGGLAQMIAGFIAFKVGNTFTGTAFTAYGLFWWSLVFILANPLSKNGIDSSDSTSLSYYLYLWCIFTLFMFFGSLKHNRTIQVVFVTLTLLFLLLALYHLTGLALLRVIAGWEGLICGLFAFYASLGQLVNQEHEKTIFPL